MSHTYGIYWGNFRKDIRKALRPGADLKHSILIDDDRTYTHEGQEKNMIHSPDGKSGDLHYLKSLVERNGKYLKEDLEDRFSMHNSVFFVAGMLEQCIKIHEAGGELTDFLFETHYKKSSENIFLYKPRYHDELSENYYELGLNCLKSVNPELSFVTAYDYIDTIATPATESEQMAMDACREPVRESNNDPCCVM